MFVLKELDKILQNIGQVSSPTAKLSTSRDQVKSIDINQLNLPEKFHRYHAISSRRQNDITDDQLKLYQFPNPLNSKRLVIDGRHYPTTDSLLVEWLNQSLFTKLVNQPEINYSWAKLLLCDRFSYDLIIKHWRIVSRASAKEFKNFLFKPPFFITALLELDSIVDIFNRSGEPLILMRGRAASESTASYNYDLIKRIFPYLKLSDLIAVIEDKGDFDPKRFPIHSSREFQILQIMSHYARSFRLIELGGLLKVMGQPHLSYNNVLFIRPPSNVAWDRLYSQVPLGAVTSIASQLASIAVRLKLRLESVTYRAGDPHEQAKIFAQFLSKLSSKTNHGEPLDSRVGRVLVLDRFYDLRGPLLHADRFGAYLDQERSQLKRMPAGQLELRPSLDSIDEQLDSQLQMVRLTEVLGIILRHALRLKPANWQQQQQQQQRRPVKPGLRKHLAPASQNYSSSATIAASRSISRNLDIVKLLYRSLNEGYLILLKLESSLESVNAELNGHLQGPRPTDKQQLLMADRLKRLISAYRQLIGVRSETLDSSDMLRLSCLIADTINLFAQVHTSSSAATDLAVQAKLSIMQANDSLARGEGKPNRSGGLLGRFNAKFAGAQEDPHRHFRAFDSLSQSTCGKQSVLPIDDLLAKMLDDKLDKSSFPTINLIEGPKSSGSGIRLTIVLVLLGAMTPAELVRIKLLEAQLTRSHQLCDIIVLSCTLAVPDDFLFSL